MTRAAALAVLLLAAPAGAHDYWLVPETYTPKDRASVPVRLFVGEHFKPEQEVAYSAKKTPLVRLVTAKGAAQISEAKNGTKPAFAFDMPGTGSAVLRVDRDWSGITLKADKFTAYLKEEGLDEIVTARAAAGEADADGKERYRRCLKTVIHGGGKPDAAPTEPLGQVLEIVPLKNPYALKAGDELPVRVEFEGKPLAGFKLVAHHRAGDTLTTATATTDKDGKAELKLPKAGPWVVRGVHMRRVAEKNPNPPADWESFWASVTFALP
ncbi:MAG: DUF4198 domain-containing protein [Planctomycetes bacterium]|nr:DUF4198 domain-containing protein [Planctomycetota bacterium]